MGRNRPDKGSRGEQRTLRAIPRARREDRLSCWLKRKHELSEPVRLATSGPEDVLAISSAAFGATMGDPKWQAEVVLPFVAGVGSESKVVP